MNSLSFSPKFSVVFAAFLMLAHLGAIVCILFSNLPGWSMGVAISVCLLSLLLLLQRYVTLKNSNAIVKIWCESSEEWCLLNRSGKLLRASLRGNSVVTNYFVLLNFKVAGKRCGISVPIFFDSLDKTLFRRLRVMLVTMF